MRILCVDDDRLVLAITADLIRSMGHDVIEAHSGRAAAQAIAAERAAIDLLITDIRMPDGCGGVELARHARSMLPELRVIYFSGALDVECDGDATTLLRKPCTLRELRQAITGATRDGLEGQAFQAIPQNRLRHGAST
jgi:CheY-like chemotaxis protein